MPSPLNFRVELHCVNPVTGLFTHFHVTLSPVRHTYIILLHCHWQSTYLSSEPFFVQSDMFFYIQHLIHGAAKYGRELVERSGEVCEMIERE